MKNSAKSLSDRTSVHSNPALIRHVRGLCPEYIGLGDFLRPCSSDAPGCASEGGLITAALVGMETSSVVAKLNFVYIALVDATSKR